MAKVNKVTDRLAAIRKANDEILATGKCPHCGGKFVRNLSMTGWWLCENKGSAGFKANKNADAPNCSFNMFCNS